MIATMLAGTGGACLAQGAKLTPIPVGPVGEDGAGQTLSLGEEGWTIDVRVPNDGQPRISYLSQRFGARTACRWVEGSPKYEVISIPSQGRLNVLRTGDATPAFGKAVKGQMMFLANHNANSLIPQSQLEAINPTSDELNNLAVADEAIACYGTRKPAHRSAELPVDPDKGIAQRMGLGQATADPFPVPAPISSLISANAHLGKPYNMAPGVTGTPVSYDQSELPNAILVNSPWVRLLVSPESGGRPAEVVAAVTNTRSCTQTNHGMALRGPGANTSNINDKVTDNSLRDTHEYFFGKTKPVSTLPDILKRVAVGPCLARK